MNDQQVDFELAQAQTLAFGLVEALGISKINPDEQTIEQRMTVLLYHHVHEARKLLQGRPDVGRVEPWLPIRVADLEPAELLDELRELREKYERLLSKYEDKDRLCAGHCGYIATFGKWCGENGCWEQPG